ncbi:MAG: ABC transporter permease, partial [Bacteroidota bacterium]
MLHNYLITAFRNFLRNRSYTLLNVLGLGLGLAGTLVIFSIVSHQTSFDHFHEKADRVYRLVDHYSADYGMEYDPRMPYPLGEALKNDIPDFEKVAQFHGPESGVFSFMDDGVVQNFKEERILFAEPQMFDMLDFQILQGEGPSALDDLEKVYLTESLAQKFFGDRNPIGRTITLDKNNQLTVAGIVADPANNTNIPFKAVVSLETHKKIYPNIYKDSWGMNWMCAIYVMLPENHDRAGIEAKLDG